MSITYWKKIRQASGQDTHGHIFALHAIIETVKLTN